MSDESPFGGMPDFPADPEFISAREASRRAVEQAGYGSSMERQRQMNRDRAAGLGGPNEPDIPEFLRSRFRSVQETGVQRPIQQSAQQPSRAVQPQARFERQPVQRSTQLPVQQPTQFAQSMQAAQPYSPEPIAQPTPYEGDIDTALRTMMDTTPVPADVPVPVPADAPASELAQQFEPEYNSAALGTSLEQLGSQLAGLDMSALEGSAPDVRWAWAEVDLGAIRHNVAVTRQQLSSRTRLMAVVKADAYGHGAIEVSRAALAAGADRLGVATVPEALELRHAGITAPILILAQPPATSIPLLVHHDITPSVYTPDFAIAYGEVADQMGKKAPFHLAMNTGMNRIGVNYDDVVEFMYQVSFHRALELEGVFTHFATSDCHESLEFERQRKRFEDAIIDLRAANFNTGIIHAANSAAIYRYPHVHYDMVRLGISLYGFHPCPETRDWVDLQPAMSVHARITDTRMVPMSEGVSYGYTYRSPGSVKVCTLPIGYGDGLSRVLSNNMDVILNGRYYRQVGNICMDQCMFEVDMRRMATLPYYDPQIGDHVLIVGREGAAEITVDELAEKMGTICHQVTIGFGERLQRVYT